MARFRRTAQGRGRRLAAVALVGGVVAGSALVPGPAGAVVGSADLSVAVTHPTTAYVTGDEITFTATVTNAGPDTATEVAVGLSLGYPMRFVAADESCDPIQYDATSVICDVGSLANGASASVDVVVEPYSAGVYTVPAVASSTTPDPDGSDNAATDTVLVRRGPLQGERYVLGEFPGVFGRTPDAGAVAFWNSRFIAARDRYPSRIVDVPSAWLNTSEYRRLRIREAYTRILGRAATGSDLTTWAGQLAKGMTYEALDRQLLVSGEFRSAHPGAATVAGAYQAVLGRAPTSAEASAAQAKLSGGASLASVVQGVQRSAEGFDVLIDQRYQSTVGHGPDAFGRYIWQTRLRNGYTVERLYAQLLVSNEVMQGYPRNNDDYPEYYEEFDRTDADTGLPVYDFSD